MKFTLIDKITECNCVDRIKAVKNLSLGEEYLADHFPGYPVMPGVLMLESMVQAACWLVRILKDFSVSMVVLVEAKNVKYGKFITPGDRLEVDVSLRKIDGGIASFSGEGIVDGQVIVSARFSLKFFNLVSRDESLRVNDEGLIRSAINEFSDLGGFKFFRCSTSN